jgi:hypothetical protein
MAENLTSGQKIWDAMRDLANQEQVITRELLEDLTGLKMYIIDSHIKTLKSAGKIVALVGGVYRIANEYPVTRSMSKTVLPDGMVKIEIGDEVLTLTPKEDRALAGLQAGAAVQYAAIDAGRASTMLAAQLGEQVKKLSRQVAALHAKVDPNQLALEVV